MDDFHFLRPLWLLALPLGPLLAWAMWRRMHAGVQWRDVCDAHLLPHLLVAPGGARGRLPYWLVTAVTTLALLALAGPAWERLEQPVYRSLNARAVVLDLSRSMDATDVAPTRLHWARDKTERLLVRRQDPTGADAALVRLVFESRRLGHQIESLLLLTLGQCQPRRRRETQDFAGVARPEIF